MNYTKTKRQFKQFYISTKRKFLAIKIVRNIFTDLSQQHNMNYTPIDCNFYDILEANAVLKKVVTIEFMDDSNNVQTTKQRIVDLFIKNKIEFMRLENGLEIRLDYLKSVDGKVLSGFCGI